MLKVENILYFKVSREFWGETKKEENQKYLTLVVKIRGKIQTTKKEL